MSIAQQLGISEELVLLVEEAFDHALPSLRVSGEPFNPFAMAEGEGVPLLHRFIGQDTRQAVVLARRSIASFPLDTSRYVLAYDGRIMVNGAKHDAIVVEAGDRASSFGVAFALRYLPTSSGEGFEETGDPIFLGKTRSHFEEPES